MYALSRHGLRSDDPYIQLQNNKLIPDMIAEKTGLTVYVPDIFHGTFPVFAYPQPQN